MSGSRSRTGLVSYVLLLLGSTLLVTGCASSSAGAAAADRGSAPRGTDGAVYYAYVAAESADLIHRLRFGPDGLTVEQTTPVGELAIENEGPHGLGMSADGRYLYMSTAHGIPDGKLWKFDAGPDTLVAPPILLGNFPATLDVTPDGLYAFVVNFNLHGEHVPSTASVVYTPDMVEVEQVPLCVMPHGMRLSPDGLFAYTNCMMDDQLVEIDTRTFEVSRRFSVANGAERPIVDYEVPEILTGATGMSRMPAGMDPMMHATEPSCSPTWAEPSPDGASVYVACNKSDEILVVDRATWTLDRKFPAGRAPYNLDVTPDGRLVIASLKSAGSVQFFDAATGESLAVVPATTTLTHGVAVTSDSRYAFVTSEAVGAQPGKVDVYDLETFEWVGSAEVGQQAGGIVFWRMEPVG